MVKRLLVIDREDQEHFFLSVEKGVMTLGGSSKSAEAVLRNLHISRIHCEVEVDEDIVVIANAVPAAGQAAGDSPLRRELHPGESLQVGHSKFQLGGATGPRAESVAAEAEPTTLLTGFSDEIMVEEAKKTGEGTAAAAANSTATHMRLAKQLFVIEGADRGRAFILPEYGSITIGKSKKNAEIVLHDLFVSRAHCSLEIDEDSVLVTHLTGDNGTLINGQKITEQHLKIGDVLRVGNEHLRLEIVPAKDDSSEEEEVVEASDGEGEEEYDLEVVEDETATETEATATVEATAADAKDPYSLPHPPVDKLLKLEGQTIGHFQIGPLLGRGQSSLVFRALDTKNQQLVALKVISPDFPANDAELQRFVKALKVLSPLQNPHLPPLCGAGKTGPYCWISREYVEGDGLVRLVQRLIEGGGRFDWTRACRVAVHLGKVLHFLHDRGITHGNITPRNVMIRKSDRVTKLADLMLNRALEGSKLQKAILGKKLMAELPYMAPEQTDPHAPGTPLGDIYSVGTVLYFLLTGQPPFAGASPREILTRIREGKVERPSKLQRGIPAPFEAAVLLMMARRPEERFPTAAEMLDAVQRIADEHEIEV